MCTYYIYYMYEYPLRITHVCVHPTYTACMCIHYISTEWFKPHAALRIASPCTLPTICGTALYLPVFFVFFNTSAPYAQIMC